MQNIKDALLKLDVGNDEHWTMEGLPRLDVLKEFVGSAVTRSQLKEIAPMFTRLNPFTETPPVEETGKEDNNKKEVVVEGEVEGEEENQVVNNKDNELEKHDLSDEEKKNERLKQLQHIYDELQQQKVHIEKEMSKVMQRMDEINIKFESTNKRSFSHDVRAYQLSQQRQREEQVLRQRNLDKLLKGVK